MANGLTIAIFSAILALAFSGIWIRRIFSQSPGNERMQEIAAHWVLFCQGLLALWE